MIYKVSKQIYLRIEQLPDVALVGATGLSQPDAACTAASGKLAGLGKKKAPPIGGAYYLNSRV